MASVIARIEKKHVFTHFFSIIIWGLGFICLCLLKKMRKYAINFIVYGNKMRYLHELFMVISLNQKNNIPGRRKKSSLQSTFVQTAPCNI